MAKGNLFLGTAKKTIGDIVLYRRNGVQQSRVRVRHIANPKTEAQALQRNYMAPVTKFYAPLAGVLERSWEGLNRSESLSAFLKANFTLARQRGWYVDKGTEFLALPYQVSKGILAPLSYSDSMLSLAETPNDIQVSTISAILVNMGYLYGDQITFIGCIRDDTKGDIRPVWSRFLLSDSDTSDVFADIANVVQFVAGANQLGYLAAEGTMVGCAIIVSRWDGSKWLRSTQFVKCNEEYLQAFTSPEARAAAIASYRGGDSIVSSDIYLNGGSGSKGSAADTLIVPFLNSSTKEVIGYCTPLSMTQPGPYVQDVIKVKNVANGEIFDVNLMNAIVGSSRYGRIGIGQGQVGWSTSPADMPYCAAWLGGARQPEFKEWMHKQGFNITG